MHSRTVFLMIAVILLFASSAWGITLFYEDFSGGLPDDWFVVPFFDPGEWVDDNPAGRTGPYSGGTWDLISDPFLIADSLFYSSQEFYAWLIAPVTNFTGVTDTHLAFDTEYYRDLQFGSAIILASSDGENYFDVETWTQSVPESNAVIDVSALVDGVSKGGTMFIYDTDDNFNVGYWIIDNVQLYGQCDSATTEDLIGDTGSSTTSTAGMGKYYVVCHTPSSYPSLLTGLDINLEDFFSIGQYYAAVFVDADGNGPDGDPVWVSDAISMGSDGWYSVDLALDPIINDLAITEGDWCVGMYDDSADGSGPMIYFDNPGTYLKSYDGTPGSFSSASADYHARASVEDCPDRCACYIDGMCRSYGELNPEFFGEYCDPEIDIAQWTTTDCTENYTDDGTSEAAWDFDIEQLLGKAFTPAQYPSFLSEVSLEFSPNAGQTGDWTVTIYQDPTGGNPDDAVQVWTSGSVTYGPTVQEWYTFDVEADLDDQPLESGTWFVAFNNNDEPNEIFLRVDVSFDDESSFIGENYGATWTAITDYPHDLSLMIRICEHTTDGCTENSDCDDGVSCTTDTCNTNTGQCLYLPDNSYCDDGFACTDDVCDAISGCSSTPNNANCDDGISCTVDTCEQDKGQGGKVIPSYVCSNTVDDSLCDDGDWCNGVETCGAVNDCQAGTSVDCNDGVSCTNDSCDETNDQCVNAVDDTNCDDGDWCNGAETCDATNDCQAGTSVDCNDGVSCTNDSCDETNDQCVNATDDTNCDDGDWCNGAETCDSINDCQTGTAPDCDDGVSCTNDSCDEINDVCVNTADDANCDNGDWCDGAETCDATNDCQAGTAPDCDDGVGCTNDSCDETNDVCVNAAIDANCDDTLFCNGVETCDATNDCQPGTDPCDSATEACNEYTDTCGPLGDDDDDDDVTNDDDDDDATEDDDDFITPDDDDDDNDLVQSDDEDNGGCCG